MNNKEKFRNTIDKIEIRDEAIQEAIKNVRRYRNERMLNMKRKNKILGIKQIIVTILTLLGLTAASYAGYVAYKNNNGTMTYKNTTHVSLEGSDEVIETIEHDGVENNGVTYDIETPAEIKVTHSGNKDRYESKYNGEEMQNGNTLPDVYMDITIQDNERKEAVQETYADYVEFYSKNYSKADKVKIGKENYDAIRYFYADGLKWDSECHTIYIVDINEDKFMVIDIQYFTEATEGWASKYIQLLDTLVIHK